jgi:hypothetical protein
MSFGLGLGFGGVNANPFNPISTSDSLIIGPVTFLDEETPNDLVIKLKQALATTVNIGGSKVSQSLGVVPDPVTWSGELFDQNVQNRIAQLNALMASGQQVSMAYLDQAYLVVVTEFEPKWLHRWRAQYTITVEIIQPVSGQYNTTVPASIQQQIDGCSTACQTLINQMAAQDSIGTAGIVAAFNVLFAAIEAAGLLSQLTGPALTALNQLVSAGIDAAEAYLNTFGPNGNSQQFFWANQLVNYSQLLGRNLQSGQSPQVSIQQGGDLFSLATKIYGDPTQAFALAAANGLVSPIIPSAQSVTVVLPPLGSSGQFT